MNEAIALEIGKGIMTHTVDATHDVGHASRVEKHTLSIWEEFRKKGLLDSQVIDQELVTLTVWWHDCYKASVAPNKRPWNGDIIEGKESVRIMKEKIGRLVAPDRIELMSEAIYYHARIINFVLKRKKIGILAQILIDADCLDLLNEGRFVSAFNKSRNVIRKLGAIWFYKILPVSFVFVFRSDYAIAIYRKYFKLFY